MFSINNQSIFDANTNDLATGIGTSSFEREGIIQKIDLCAKEVIEEKQSERKDILFNAAKIKENVQKIVQNRLKLLNKNNIITLHEKIINTIGENFVGIQQGEADVKQLIPVSHNNTCHKVSAINTKINGTTQTFISFPFLCGKGGFKHVKLAADHSGILYAITALPSKKVHFKRENPGRAMPSRLPSLPHKEHDKIFADTKTEIEMQRRFKNEPEFVQISHSCIYQGSDQKSKHLIIMEFCEKNLQEIISSTELNMLSQEQEKIIINVLHDMLLGVAKMQQAGVIHRDLKPENVMVKISGNGEEEKFTAKICDFGLAVHNYQAARAKVGEGTPLYMSPEILKHGNLKFLNMQIKSTQAKIARLAEQICCQDVQLNKPYVKEDPELFNSADAKKKEALTNKKNMEDLLDSYQFPIHGKSDVWACGLIIFEILFKKRLYDKLCPDLDRAQLVTLAYRIGQNQINTLLEAENFDTQFKRKLMDLLKKMLIVNRSERPDQQEAYDNFCAIFDLEPVNYQFA